MPSDSDRSPKLHFFGTLPAEFDAAVAGWGWPRFRGQQVRDWVYGKLIADPASMSNLSPRDRDRLRQDVAFAQAVIARRQSSADGTDKLLLTWGDAAGPSGTGAASPTADGSSASSPGKVALPMLDAPGPPIASAETVMIPDGDRRTACVSSQVGCPVGCAFCASGINGVKGNLTAAQIVEQVYQLNLMLQTPRPVQATSADAADDDETGMPTNFDRPEGARQAWSETEEGADKTPAFRPGLSGRSVGGKLSGPPKQERITNIVFMGMGEPLANYNNVMQAIRVLHDPKCFNLGARRITISTVGVPPRMRDLANEDLPLNLAISLHAPNEPLRRQLIPWAEHFALDDILDAARYYFDRTGREVTLEYILLAGVNDRPDHARQLAKLCKTLRANVNLIRYNEVESLPFGRPKADDVVTFQNILRNAGVNAHVRKSRGRDIDAACGQLRRKQETAGQVAMSV